MSDKPSLYVVEKREVVILVVLFVLVTVLAFTMGVRYGESVGKKAAQEQLAASAEHSGAASEATGGTLGAASGAGEHGAAAGHGEAAKDEHGSAEHHDEADKGAKPEVAAKSGEHDPEAAPPAKDAADKNSDETLLNALKEAGVEPPGGKTVNNAKLPPEVKAPKEVRRIPSGTYVIQVGSHPTRSEAEAQVRQLSAKKVSAEILPAAKDRQGEWHRVVVGKYKNKREAERDANALKNRRAIVSFFVWRLP